MDCEIKNLFDDILLFDDNLELVDLSNLNL